MDIWIKPNYKDMRFTETYQCDFPAKGKTCKFTTMQINRLRYIKWLNQMVKME